MGDVRAGVVVATEGGQCLQSAFHIMTTQVCRAPCQCQSLAGINLYGGHAQTDQHRLSRQHEYQAVCSCANKLTLHPGSCCYAMMRNMAQTNSSPAWPNGNCNICSYPLRATHIGRSVLPASRPLNGGVVTCRLGLYHDRHAGHQQGACCGSHHGPANVAGRHRVFW